jgi:cytochrome P450
VARFGDQRFYLRAFQRYGPVFKVLWNRNIAVCVVGFDRARRLLAIHGRALAQLTIDITPLVPKGFLRGMAREDHRQYRALILAAIRNDLAAGCATPLRDLLSSELTLLAHHTGHEASPRHAVLTPRLHQLATRSLLIAFFGQRPGDVAFAQLESGFNTLSVNGVVSHLGEEQHSAFTALRSCIEDLIERQKNEAPAVAASVLSRLVAQHDPRATDETMIGNLIYMVELGRYDIRSLLRWIVKHLSDHPGVVASLAAVPADGTTSGDVRASLARACVMETLRLEQVDALNRTVAAEFMFDGHRFPTGAAVRVLLRESHRDPAVFEEPDQYRPCRFAATSPSSRDYAPFGLGEHRCVASEFVVDFATLCVEELTGGFTWSVANDGPSEKLSHAWEPSASFEITLRPRRRVSQTAELH